MVKFFISVSDTNSDILEKINSKIFNLPIKWLTTVKDYNYRSWGFVSKVQRDKAIKILQKENLDFELSEFI